MSAAPCLYCDGKCRRTSVYVIGEAYDAASVKVGYAANAVKRLAQLRRQSGRDLVILHVIHARCEFKAMDIEDAAHVALAQSWTGRGEWFACPAIDARNAVDNAARRLGLKGDRP